MRLKSLFGVLAIATLFACSPSEPSSTSTSTASKDEFKVALLTPGPVSDAGWSAMAYDGLQAIKSEMNATVDNQQATGTQIRDALRSYAQKDYNLVFGHGFEYNEPAVEVAKDFPKTVFVSSSGGETGPNAGAFRFYLEQGFYLAGWMAAKLSKTGKVGSVAVQDYPSIVSTLKAYEAGAKAANPSITVLPTVYFGTEGDVAKAKQATESVLAQGADFVIHQANAAAPGIFEACAEKGAHAFGSNLDQNDQKSVVASALISAKPAFLDLAKRVQAGDYKGEVSLYGMQEGAIDFKIAPTFESEVPEDLKKELAEKAEEIRSGKIVVPKDEF
jgi:basic membrane lipoprotein Med (substrate-binding protein (PBP1-ABC) superfamily)